MQLRRIEIAEFRKITHREITHLDDGLNIVVGDNEAGKSTMLAALRAVFFERHRVGGAAAEAMQPYGGTLRPTIRVEFELDGKPWSLAKSFCQRQEASLVGPGERLSGDAVDDRLAELFGFSPPGRGGSKPEEHQGTHGLLWVEQGTRNDLGIGAGRGTLAAALESEVGQVTGGERGRALIAAAAKRRERFWDRRDKPRGEASTQRKLVEELEREQADLGERRRAHEGKIARLAAVGERLARHRRDDRVATAAAAVAAAGRAVDEAGKRGVALEAAERKRAEAERAWADAVERREARLGLVAKRDRAQVDAGAVRAELEDAEAVARRAAAAAADAGARFQAAGRAREQADNRLRALEDAWQRQRASAALRDLESTLAAAETQAAAQRDAQARVAAAAIDERAVKTLAALERAADQALAELAAASVQLLFEPEGDRAVTVAGAAHVGREPVRLARDTEVVLEGFGRVLVRPGGGTAPLMGKADESRQALEAALARCRASTVEDARRRLAERTQAEAEAAMLAKALTLLAPNGLEPLRHLIAVENARLARPSASDGPLPQGMVDAWAVEEAKRVHDDLRVAEIGADKDAKAAATARERAATALAIMVERSATAARQARTCAEELAAARLKADDEETAVRVAAAEAAVAGAVAASAEARAALAASDPETAQLTLDRARRAELEIRKDVAALETDARDLRVELRAVGQEGIGERLSELEGELHRERQRLAIIDREAAASRLLHETLLAAQRDAKDRWLGPVRRRVEPYLRLIHPDSEVRIDDQTLEIEGLMRDGVLERFGALSMGAREQVAVITRLALADVLRSAGHPAAVILDDALVNTDETRLERMRNVLALAARSLQILIFTCRERDFLGLGATHRV